jgi:hypothetical protein
MRTVIEPRTGIAAVHFMLLHRYRCAAGASTTGGCRPSRYLRPEVVYLISSRGGWAIVKPGLVYEVTTIPTPLGQESNYYPPGDAATIRSPASLPAVSRIDADTACFTITLAAPPLPDDAYNIGVGTVAQEAAADVFGSNPVLRNATFVVEIGTDTIQDDEPLVTQPVDAGDLVPFGACLVFPTGQLDHQGNCGSTPSG